ncbi:MAG: MAPEG family protein, partial [Dokdonella sp.]
ALGAQLYFWARLAYLPTYAAGIPYLRTVIWGVAIVGLAMVLGGLF